ncbi:hypothetical protein, partial [Streptomyces mirabilis]
MCKDSVRPIAEAGLVSFVERGSTLTPDLPIPSSWSRRRSPALSGRPRPEPAWHPDHPETPCAVVPRTRASCAPFMNSFSGPGEPERRRVRNGLRPPQSGDDGSTDFLD